jgi:ribosomal protein L11 methyltransferase
MYHTRLSVTCDPQFSEILIAEIADAGFDTFLENENGFEAYAEVDRFDQNRVEEVKKKYSQVKPLEFAWDRIEKKNWNEEWEKSYEPIIVDNRCLIKAVFHKLEKSYPYEITITPKMSFGTGHHQTTYLMINAQMDLDHKNKRVMDAGCGTAILSIMASKLGATHIDAFDIVLANINKNILLQELPQYVAYLNPKGHILLSGFYEKDIPDLMAKAQLYHLKHVKTSVRENWSALLLQLNKE